MELADWAAGIVPEALKGTLPEPEKLAPLRRKIRTDFHTAAGWRRVRVEYTCIPDPTYPWDPRIMRAILRFAPDAVPLWVRSVFRSPQDEENPHDVVYGRHALGRHIEHLSAELIDFNCTMPTMPCQGLTFEKPNRIWFIHQEGDPTEKYVDLPGDYLPFDGTILDKAERESAGFQMTEKEYIEFLREEMLHRPRREKEQRKKFNAEEKAYMDKEWERTSRPIIDSISDVEIGEYLRRNKGSTP
jgi:hypothetical protein